MPQASRTTLPNHHLIHFSLHVCPEKCRKPVGISTEKNKIVVRFSSSAGEAGGQAGPGTELSHLGEKHHNQQQHSQAPAGLLSFWPNNLCSRLHVFNEINPSPTLAQLINTCQGGMNRLWTRVGFEWQSCSPKCSIWLVQSRQATAASGAHLAEQVRTAVGRSHGSLHA